MGSKRIAVEPEPEVAMQQICLVCLVFFVALLNVRPLRGQDKPSAIVEKAIAAHGGEKNFARCKTGEVKMKGTFKVPGVGDFKFDQDDTFQLPGKFRRETRLEVMGKMLRLTYVFNGAQGWLLRGDGELKMLDPKAAAALEDHPALSFTRLVDLRDPMAKITLLPETKIDGRDAVGIKVEIGTANPDELYFDKTSGLLIKRKRRAVDPLTGKEGLIDTFLGNYKDVSGVKVPTTITAFRDGELFMAVTSVQTRLLDRVDEKVFAKPQ
jgi:hypothetical protein